MEDVMTIEAATVEVAGEPLVERYETIVIGGGQAGLSVGYYLKKHGRSFLILDANERIGGSWRTRTWSSLRLFTPARYDGLAGWPFPAPGWSFPTAPTSSWKPVTGASRPTMSSSRPASTVSLWSRTLQLSSIRASCRCTPAS